MLVGLIGVVTQSGPITTGVEAVLIQLAAFLVASVSTVWALSLLAPSSVDEKGRAAVTGPSEELELVAAR